MHTLIAGTSPQALFSRAAALAVVAMTLLAVAACGDDDGGQSPTPTPDSATDAPTATPAPAPGETPDVPISGGLIDLAVTPAQMTVYARETDDLLTGATNVALGDFNGDGVPDILIGAPQADAAGGERRDAGEAYVFFGPLEGEVDIRDGTADITIHGASDVDGLGFTVHAGDLNDDGVDDVMVGAPGVTAGFDPRTDQGRLYVFYGGEHLNDVEEFDLANDVYDLTVTGSEGFSRLSTSVALGDINGDGRTDLLVSSPFAGRAPGTPPGSQRTAEGEVYIIFGTDADLTGEYNIAAGDYDVLLGGTQEFGQFGASFAVGDFNGDGFDDVVVGAHRNNAADGRPSAGEAYVFFGSGNISGRLSVLDGAQDITISGAVAGSAFGLPIAAGDFNGDGIDDFAIGAQSEGIENIATAGVLRIFFGGSDLPQSFDLSSTPADVTLYGGSAGGLMPSAVAVGDVNGDGLDDLIFSSSLGGASVGRSTAGLIYVLRGAGEFPALIDLDDDMISQPIIGPTENARAGAAIWSGVVDETGASGLALLSVGASAGDGRESTGAVFVVRLEIE